MKRIGTEFLIAVTSIVMVLGYGVVGGDRIQAQTFLTADIPKPFSFSVRPSSSYSEAFFTASLFGSYSYEDFIQVFLDAGYVRIDFGAPLTEVDGMYVSIGVKNKYYHDHPEGIPMDLAWYVRVDAQFYAGTYEEIDLGFRLMSLRFGHIFSKHLSQFEPYCGFGLAYSVNDYDGPASANDVIPDGFDFFLDTGIRWSPVSYLAFTVEGFLYEKPGFGGAIEVIF